jgi:hypothetical protein
MSGPNIKKKDDVPIQPPDEKRLELNPETQGQKTRAKKLGTKRLQIPLKKPGQQTGSGLKI